MSRDRLTAEILREIEFELVQGALGTDELSEGAQTVREYQQRLRRELFERKGNVDARDAANRLFQLNEMLLTLIEESARTIQGLRLELRGAERLAARPLASMSPLPLPATTESAPASTALPGRSAFADVPFLFAPPATPVRAVSQSELEGLMSEKALQVQMDARPVGVPVIGPLLQRVRVALHSAILFYVNKIARKQLAVNKGYGEMLLNLNAQLQYQREEIQRLQGQIAALQGQAAPHEEDAG